MLHARCQQTRNKSLNDILTSRSNYSTESLFNRRSFQTTTLSLPTQSKCTGKSICKKTNEIFRGFSGNQTHSIQYRLNTVTYGLATAPFLAIRCLHQLAYDNQDKNPAISDIIRNDFYVDLLTSADTIDQIRSIKQEVSRILLTGKLLLRKWNINTLVVIEEEYEAGSSLDRLIGEEVKTLGLYWNPSDDVFRYKINVSDTNERAREISFH